MPAKGRGGSRKHPAGCQCGSCPQIGRHPNNCACQACAKKHGVRLVDHKMAARIKQKANAEQLYLSIIERECKRLDIDFETGVLLLPPPADKKNRDGVIDGPDFRGNFSILPLFSVLKYLDDRDEGKPHETVHHVHETPQDLRITLTVSERMKAAMEKGEKRLAMLARR